MHDLHKFTFSDIFLSYEYSFTFKVIISIQHRCYILYASLFTHQDTSILNNVFLVSMDVTSLYTPGGYSKTFFSWEAPPRGPTPYPYIPFWTEKVCFSNTFYWRMIPLSYTLFRFLDFFAAINWSVRPFGPLHRPKWEISGPFYTSSILVTKEQENLRCSKISTLFIYLTPAKGTPMVGAFLYRPLF